MNRRILQRQGLERCAVLILAIGISSLVCAAAPLSHVTSPQPTGMLSGLILDPGEARISRATILVEGKEFRRMVTSGDDGSYKIELPEGKYKISVTRGGFYTSRKKTVRIRSDAALTLVVTLK